jgi:hypothetical protein
VDEWLQERYLLTIFLRMLKGIWVYGMPAEANRNGIKRLSDRWTQPYSWQNRLQMKLCPVES